MSQLQAVLAIIGALFGLAVLAGGLWAVSRSTSQDARIERLQGERDDLLSRLNFIEPRFLKVEEQNKVLTQLHNPADQIEALRAQEQTNHDATVRILQEQSRTLHEIEEKVRP